LAKKGNKESQLRLVEYYKTLYKQRPNQINSDTRDFLKYLRLAEANDEIDEKVKKELRKYINQVISKLDQYVKKIKEAALCDKSRLSDDEKKIIEFIYRIQNIKISNDIKNSDVSRNSKESEISDKGSQLSTASTLENQQKPSEEKPSKSCFARIASALRGKGQSRN